MTHSGKEFYSDTYNSYKTNVYNSCWELDTLNFNLSSSNCDYSSSMFVSSMLWFKEILDSDSGVDLKRRQIYSTQSV